MEILSTTEAASFLRRSPAAIRNMVLRRTIPFRKPAGRLVFIKAELESWIQGAPGISVEELKKEGRPDQGRPKD